MRKGYVEKRKATYKKCRQRSRLYDSMYNGVNNYDTIHRYAKTSVPAKEKSPSHINTRDVRTLASLGDSIKDYEEEG